MGLRVSDTKSTEKKDAKAKTQAAVEAQATVTENADTSKYGIDSDKLIFLNPLGDPSQPDVTPVTKNGKTEKVTTSTIVGYRFKAAIDLDVPDVAPGADFRNNLMSYSGDVSATKHVKAGEEFILTKFETGLLISQERFNGRATGGDRPVVCSYTTVNKKSSAGAVASTSAASAVPSIALRAINQGQSVKDYKMEDVLDVQVEKVKTQNGEMTRKHRTIKPGYEKFAMLCQEKASAPRSGAGSSAPKNERNAGAEAFLRILAAKKA